MPGHARVAVVHDAFTQLGGGERVAGSLASIFDAELFTAAAHEDIVRATVPERTVRTSFLQPLVRRGVPLRLVAPALPVAFAALDVGPADVVISSSAALAHHVRVPRGAVHVCYCHTPPRFLWETDDYFQERSASRRLYAPGIAAFRRLDRAAARRVDVYVANSMYTAGRIRSAYGREALVIPPPTDVRRFIPSTEQSGRFLVVSRLRSQKRIDLAIEAANLTGLPLDIIGDGSELESLRRLAGPSVQFLGRRSDDDVRAAMARATAIIVPAIGDFGLTIVEAQASGRPPIAFARGGALEIVDDGRTGFLFHDQSPAALAFAMHRAATARLDIEVLRESAMRFDLPVFESAIRTVLVDALAERRRVTAAAQSESPEVTADPITIGAETDLGRAG